MSDNELNYRDDPTSKYKKSTRSNSRRESKREPEEQNDEENTVESKKFSYTVGVPISALIKNSDSYPEDLEDNDPREGRRTARRKKRSTSTSEESFDQNEQKDVKPLIGGASQDLSSIMSKYSSKLFSRRNKEDLMESSSDYINDSSNEMLGAEKIESLPNSGNRYYASSIQDSSHDDFFDVIEKRKQERKEQRERRKSRRVADGDSDAISSKDKDDYEVKSLGEEYSSGGHVVSNNNMPSQLVSVVSNRPAFVEDVNEFLPLSAEYNERDHVFAPSSDHDSKSLMNSDKENAEEDFDDLFNENKKNKGIFSIFGSIFSRKNKSSKKKKKKKKKKSVSDDFDVFDDFDDL